MGGNMRIGIIGPTGAGKTLLSQKLAAYYHAKLIEQVIEKNEYLPHFYKDKETFALLSQTAFYSSLFLSSIQHKDQPDIVADETLFGNLAYTEILRLCGIMTATEAALTFSVSEDHLRRLPSYDLHIVLVRSPEALLDIVHKRARPFEKDQDEYLEFVFDVYYDTIKRIFKNYKVPEEHILFLPVHDLSDPDEFKAIIAKIDAISLTADR
jgi:deoxyguanosine kinase